MTTFPVLLNKLEIRNFLKTLSSDQSRIAYLNDLKEELETILDYYSDAELKNYIEENNLREKYGLEERNNNNKKVEEPDKQLNIFEIIQGLFMLSQANLKMLCSKYSYLHFQIKTSLLPYINDELAKINNSIGLVDFDNNFLAKNNKQKPLLLSEPASQLNNFDYSFTEEELLFKLDKFKSNLDKEVYIKKLISNLEELYDNCEDNKIELLLKERNLDKKPPFAYIDLFDDYDSCIENSKYKQFLYYLKTKFIPDLSVLLCDLTREIIADNVIDMLKKGEVNDDVKYPVLDFKHSEIIKFANRVYNDLDDKFEYYSFVLLAFKKKYGGNKFIVARENENIENDMKLLKAELDFLKLKIKLRKSRTKTNKSSRSKPISVSHIKINNEKIIRDMKRKEVEIEQLKAKNQKLENQTNKFKPKSRFDIDLINHFIKVAVSINDFPSLDKLTSPSFKKSSWSKKLWNSEFLSLLYKTVNAKLSHKQLSDKNKNLYLLIIDFITKRADEIKTNHTQNAGSTSKTKPNFDENISDEIQDVFNNL